MAAQGSSFRPLSPPRKDESHTRGGLPWQWELLREVAGGDLALELGRCGASTSRTSKSSVSRLDRLDAAWNLAAGWSVGSPAGCRGVPGLRSTLVSGKIAGSSKPVYGLSRSRSGSALPLTRCHPERGTIKQEQAGPTSACSGRLRLSHPWCPATLGGLEERRWPATGAR